ncbi:MAG: metalloprotease TldD [Kistimonas sp.]|nr:metalloprotease TldD [Kistimonas sp.]
MTDILTQTRQELLEPGSLDDNQLEHVIHSMLGHQIDAADLYFQSTRCESWVLEDGLVREGSYSADRGVGARAVCGEKVGFAYANAVTLPALQAAAGASRSIVRQGQTGQMAAWSAVHPTPLYAQADPIGSLSRDEKVRLLQDVDAEVRRLDSRVRKVSVSLSGSHEHVLFAAADGTLAADIRPLVRLNVSVIMEDGDRRESGSYGGGGRADYDMFIQRDLWKDYASEAVRQAEVNLRAVAAPAGTMPVVLGPGWNGVLLHEAVGHGLEGDFNRKGSSVYAGRVGERVASPLCTIVDDGTLVGRRGSLSMDDEGVPSGQTLLVENGILKGYMQDRMNAKLMGTVSTGNGRRESYAHLPMPRMTNTYLLPGDHAPDEIIASVDNGLYIANMGGGQVDITSGKFVFSTSEAYLIEGGRITRPVKGATLIGNGPEAMNKVSMVGDDMKLDSGVGVCGKDGQSVPVGVGQPTLKMDAMTVGGTSA